MKSGIKYSLLTFSDDEGVKNVKGRVGAASGPARFRYFSSKLSGHPILKDSVHDVGDLTENRNYSDKISLLEKHEIASELVRLGVEAANPLIVVGGGHDFAYSHLKGIAKSFKKIGCINIDAHFDLRKPNPLFTSGSPFYLAIEEGILHPSRFVEFGIQEHCNAPELWKYAKSKKIKTIPFSKLRLRNAVAIFEREWKRLEKTCDALVLSLDLDALSSAYCPGVSAPQAEGFDSQQVISMTEIAAKSKKCVSFGVFELNPLVDVDDRTARFAATVVHRFLSEKFSLFRNL